MTMPKQSLYLLLLAALILAMPHAYAAEEEGKAPKGDVKAESLKPEADGGKDKKATDVSGGRFAGDPIYVHIDPLLLPIITDRGVEQLITIMMDIEVKDFDVADTLHTQMPRVRDALMRALYGGLGQGSLRAGKLADVAKIKAKASNAIVEVIGQAGIRDVLIQGIAQRML